MGNLPRFGEPVGVAVADFNKDGKPDICFIGGTDMSFNYSALAMGTGTANFRIDSFFYGDFMNPIAETADIDGDGYPDLFFGNTILRNRGRASGVQMVVKQDMELSVAPNPAFAGVDVIWTARKGGAVHIGIYTLCGARVSTQEAAAKAGPNVCTLDLTKLPSATCLIVVQSADGYDMQRLVKL